MLFGVTKQTAIFKKQMPQWAAYRTISFVVLAMHGLTAFLCQFGWDTLPRWSLSSLILNF